MESADVSIFLLPKATSEQQESGMFPPDGTTQQFHHTEDSQKPENLGKPDYILTFKKYSHSAMCFCKLKTTPILAKQNFTYGLFQKIV